MLHGYILLVNKHVAFFLLYRVIHLQVFQQPPQYHVCMADDAHDLAIFYHRRTTDVESLEQARAVTDIHVRMHGHYRLGHDLVDVDPLG